MPGSKQDLLRANHDLIAALWRQKASDLEIAIELEATRAVDVSPVTISIYRRRYGMPAWPWPRDGRMPRRRVFTDEQHLRLLKQFHIDRMSWRDMASYWRVSTITIYNYLWKQECRHPDAARIVRRTKKAGCNGPWRGKVPVEERPAIKASPEPNRVLAARYGVSPGRIWQIRRAA